MGYVLLDHHLNVRVGVLYVWENNHDNNLLGCSFVLAAHFAGMPEYPIDISFVTFNEECPSTFIQETWKRYLWSFYYTTKETFSSLLR